MNKHIVRKGEFSLEDGERDSYKNAIIALNEQELNEIAAARELLLKAESMKRTAQIYLHRADSFRQEREEIEDLFFPRKSLIGRIREWFANRKPAGGLGDRVDGYEDLKAYAAKDAEAMAELYSIPLDEGDRQMMKTLINAEFAQDQESQSQETKVFDVASLHPEEIVISSETKTYETQGRNPWNPVNIPTDPKLTTT